MPLNPVPNYPTSLDSLPNPTVSTYEDDDGFELDLLLQKHNAIVQALEAKLGIGNTTPDAVGKVFAATVAGTGNWGYNSPYKLAGGVPLGSAAASIAFTAIPQTFRSLMIVLMGRGDTAANTAAVSAQFAASGVSYDAGANYDTVNEGGTGTSNFSFEAFAGAAAGLGSLPAANATAGAAGLIEILIPNYIDSTFWTTYITRYHYRVGTTTGTMQVGQNAGQWRNTSPLVALQLFPGAGNFLAGTVATLYGLP